MKFAILCMRDRSADVFGVPMFQAAVGTGIRAFSDEINRSAPDNVMNRHPEDFDLYELGSYDDQTCEFVLLPAPRMVAIGKDCVRK